jgi:hypothetical protein
MQFICNLRDFTHVPAGPNSPPPPLSLSLSLSLLLLQPMIGPNCHAACIALYVQVNGAKGGSAGGRWGHTERTTNRLTTCAVAAAAAVLWSKQGAGVKASVQQGKRPRSRRRCHHRQRRKLNHKAAASYECVFKGKRTNEGGKSRRRCMKNAQKQQQTLNLLNQKMGIIDTPHSRLYCRLCSWETMLHPGF